jgi:hypothetical protein
MCLALGLAACGPTQAELDQQAATKARAQDAAAQAELDQCNAQYPSPVARENAVAKFRCMNTAYHHFSRKYDQFDEDYFAKNLDLAQQYADGRITYDGMQTAIARNVKILEKEQITLTYQLGMERETEEESAERARSDKAAQGAREDAQESDQAVSGVIGDGGSY